MIIRQIIQKDDQKALRLLVRTNYNWMYSSEYNAYVLSKRSLKLLRDNNIKMRVIIPSAKKKKKKKGSIKRYSSGTSKFINRTTTESMSYPQGYDSRRSIGYDYIS